MSLYKDSRITELLAQPSTLVANPTAFLREVAATKTSGCLEVMSNQLRWVMHFNEGNLTSAAGSFQSLETLEYHFRCLNPQSKTPVMGLLSQAGVDTNVGLATRLDTHNCLTKLQQQGHLNVLQLTQLLENLTKEALETFLWVTEAHCRWIVGDSCSPRESVLNPDLDLNEVLQHFEQRLQEWQTVRDQIQSPHQRPYLFARDLDPATDNSAALCKFRKILKGLSIRQLALVLNQDELKVAKVLYPFIKRGEIYLRDPSSAYESWPQVPKREPAKPAVQKKTQLYKIACIDDSPTILDEMQRFLGQEEYAVTKIDDPVKATAMLFRLKPDLVLMDITMPEINGYKLCSLLRNSVALRETPIIMVSGRSGLIDKARAKVTGATDYLVKPFTRGSLLAIVEKYLY
jgi:twitching motility two-component system response regulator PilG